MKKVFILGNPRSGTSLLRLMLNVHSKIVAPPECGFLHWWFTKYREWNIHNNKSKQINTFINDLSNSKKIETWCLNYHSLGMYIKECEPESYGQLGELIYLFYARSHDKKVEVIIDKNNYYIHHLNDLIKIWPDAYFIHLIRDGRDVACSYIDMKRLETTSNYKPVLSDKIEDIANEWTSNNININNFISKNNSQKSLVMRYEDLVSNTKSELQKACDFLELDFDKSMLNYFKVGVHNEPKQTMDWKKKTLLPPDKKNIGRYKFFLKDNEIKTFNQIALNTLKQFNYDIK